MRAARGPSAAKVVTSTARVSATEASVAQPVSPHVRAAKQQQASGTNAGHGATRVGEFAGGHGEGPDGNAATEREVVRG